jgi:hypothetical protein
MSSRNRHTIRSPKSFRKGSGMNAMRVNNCFTELVEQKKREIKNTMQDLAGKIIKINNVIETQRAVRFNVEIAGKTVIMAFIIWTDERGKDNDFTNSQFAKLVFRLNEDFKNRVINYLEGIQKGCLTEYLYGLALEELEGERKIHSFNKTGRIEDIRKKDFVVRLLKDGIIKDLYLQVKSSCEALMAVKDELFKEGISGSFYSFTGNSREDIDAIKMKIVEIVEEFKKGNVIFV